MSQQIFNRIEKKYLLNESQYNILFKEIQSYLEKDKHYFNKINNIYFDTNNYELIRNSIEKPAYKEKVRIRSYGIPKLEDKVFLEIKKKYNGIVNKRRIELPLAEIYNFLDNSIIPNGANVQIAKELEYCLKRYDLMPKVYVGYDRYAYYDRENPNFRITFDVNLKSRDYDLNLEKGDYGEKFFDQNIYLMEVKTLGALPLWFVKIINKLQIYPSSFSKYGGIYKEKIIKKVI